MSTVREAFEEARQFVQALPERPPSPTLLRLYGLYKQATEGDIDQPRPGFFDFVGTAKFEAWEALKGTPPEAAMQQYVDLVKQLRG